ncbi:hypothetical protein LRS73_19475 [Methylobacterium currus]|uniref:hypothetical protein n=1 Tax=Methylobacterium currus TaxID=2051553 RepID=UPI001E63076D|nr:hypothetical protein [Methylobacterium currus]UHC14709.1 hypothetical protein LRS73_19475 [Methylobacterium currus]
MRVRLERGRELRQNRLIASVETRGSTRPNAEPVSGSTAAKMEADWKRPSQRPDGRCPRIHQQWPLRPFCPTRASSMKKRRICWPE